MANRTSILSIAGLDPSGCAGITLDSAVIRALGFHSCTIVTSITFQNTCKAIGHEVVPREVVEKQLLSILEDLNIAGVKIGVIHEAHTETLKLLNDFDVVVWDPVFKSTTGHTFSDISRIAKRVCEVAKVITPNKYEAEVLSGVKIESIDDARACAEKLSEMLNVSVVITGGGLEGNDVVYDMIRDHVFTVSAEFSDFEIRGTGCAYSTALTCFLTKRKLDDACRLARLYLLSSVKSAKPVGKCHPCVTPATDFVQF
ncbi:Hydroxymethylpyrimidine/phosphomethylpyrimidine kinase [Archaeoglobus sulfaticallidus PM70-1]|uniref:Hydroxymethylpyrimidine/phosphomethylpyrimidine kinase n=1 Tax=Archaeoglobus sulfaticallidus PM70-1 TaxID=387631 RepID=N0BKT2_9EURY|nr:hydroxymethylpyrimidine/phosphomethylpyrimidine kinase [Archaeoglobus sulfaticallidus]AGK60820.1 Hydroxymethylpyrimidine/phosphomethylpyrimidine kinase [Archaeoglobus sulfaticallidus PM70-1]